jgi:transcriptional regulator with XRE-family HTH domain
VTSASNGETALGSELRRLREEAGLSQATLAQRAGLDTSYISRIERGARITPRLRTILRLAEALELGAEQRERLLRIANVRREHLAPSRRSFHEGGSPLYELGNVAAPSYRARALPTGENVPQPAGRLQNRSTALRRARIVTLERRIGELVMEVRHLAKEAATITRHLHDLYEEQVAVEEQLVGLRAEEQMDLSVLVRDLQRGERPEGGGSAASEGVSPPDTRA